MPISTSDSLYSHTNTSHVFALDFDGVLCDSAAEGAVTAWRAGQHIWSDWLGEEPPADLKERLIRLRPVIETGYQFILLLKLILEGYTDNQIAREFNVLCEDLMKVAGTTRTVCAALFDQARDQWIKADLTDWLARHEFYPSILDAFVTAQKQYPIFIVTTKSERFVKQLLANHHVVFPQERIFGLDRKQSKEAMLLHLASLYVNAKLHFVEDRLATLLRVTKVKELESIQLYLADWGYNTPSERSLAADNKCITLWDRNAFLVFPDDVKR